MGGLPKKIFQIKNRTAEQPGNILLLDSGNLLFKRKTVAKGVNQERLTANTILTIYKDIGFDAVAVGPRDLSGGLTLLQDSKKDGFPWISANITDNDGKLLFNNLIKKEIQGQHIVITAISHVPERAIPGIKVLSWDEVLPALLKDIKVHNPDSFLILLSSLSIAENKRIAKKFPEISLLIGADSSKGNIAPLLTNKTIITQTTKQGKYMGILNVRLGKKRVWGKDSQKKLATLQNRLGSVNWQLSRLMKKAKAADLSKKYEKTISRLKKEKEELNTAIIVMKQQVAEEQKMGSNTDQYTYSFLALKKNMPNDQATVKRIEKLNSAIRSLNQKRKHTINTTTGKNNIRIPTTLVGSDTCYTCHELQTDFWKTTSHATAYNTLVKTRKNLDLECLPCHMTIDVTGGKFQSLVASSLLSYPEDLQSVGCETCHGSGQKHLQNPQRFKLVRTPGINICLTCHTDEHDDNFQYKSKLSIIACPAS